MSYNILEQELPQELLNLLPEDLKNAIHSGFSFIAIVEAYNELKKGAEQGFYEYYFSPNADCMVLSTKNYDQRCKTIAKQVDELKSYFTTDVSLVFPRQPNEIAKELYHTLIGNIKIEQEVLYRTPNAEPIILLDEQNTMSIVKIITGYKKAIERKEKEKFSDTTKYQILKTRHIK